MSSWCCTALLDPRSRWLALFCVAASLVFPFSTGVDLCMLHAATGLPCPGCGMTRAFVAVAAGEWPVALGANPFVLIAYPTFVLLAALALLPEAWAERALQVVGARAARAYGALVLGFLGFGVLRFAYFAVTRQEFP